ARWGLLRRLSGCLRQAQVPRPRCPSLLPEFTLPRPSHQPRKGINRGILAEKSLQHARQQIETNAGKLLVVEIHLDVQPAAKSPGVPLADRGNASAGLHRVQTINLLRCRIRTREVV